MNLLQSLLLCRSNNEEDQQQHKKKEKTMKQTKAPNRLPFVFSIRFLYKNPIGRAFLAERVSRDWHKTIHLASIEPELDKDAQLSEYVHSIPRAIRYKKLLLQGYLVYPSVLKHIESFEVRPDDVWLVTYPKSGTTWTEEILSLIFSDGDLDYVNQKLLAERVPHLEVGQPIGHLRWIKNIASPRLIATHLDIEHAPTQLAQLKAKIIYVMRNPKDTAVSYYHHHKMSSFLGNYSGQWPNFLELFLKGQLVYGDWFAHVSGYWRLAQHNPTQILFISYEELKTNLSNMIELISNFVGHPISPETISLIARQCSFEEMKNNTMVNREVLPVPDLFDMSQTKFMRKGIIGDWRAHFSQDESDRFDRVYGPALHNIGLQVAYDMDQAQKLIEQGGGRIVHLPATLSDLHGCVT